MKRLKDWFLLKFLPAWAKDTVYTENQRLRQEIKQLHQEIERVNAYADGLEYALRRRIVIRNEVNR